MSLPPEIPQPINRPNAQPEPEDQLQQVEREMTGFERGTLRWAKVAVFMSALAAIFVCLQWWEMHTGATDTHALATAAGKQAEAASKQADRMKDFADRMKDQADRTKTIAEQAKVSADAAKKSADAAAAVQRPWLRLSLRLTRFTPIERGYDLTLIPTLGNDGTGVGTKVSLRIEYRIPPFPSTSTFKPGDQNAFTVAWGVQAWCDSVKPNVSGLGTYFPGDHRDEPKWTFNVIDADMLKSDNMLNGEARFLVLVYGCVLYRFEPFPEWHHTGIVYELSASRGGIPELLAPKHNYGVNELIFAPFPFSPEYGN